MEKMMDKNAIKKFAVWARTELIARVSLKGVEYGITEDNMVDANADSVGGKDQGIYLSCSQNRPVQNSQ